MEQRDNSGVRFRVELMAGVHAHHAVHAQHNQRDLDM